MPRPPLNLRHFPAGTGIEITPKAYRNWLNEARQ